jgi:tetratricopeptide (TPR) repeat protein
MDLVLSSDLLLALAALLTLVVAFVLVLTTLGARRGGAGKHEIGTRFANSAAPHVAQEPVVAIEDDGLEPYRWALAVRENAVGPDHPDVATACHILGAMYMERERFAEAEPLLKRALEIRTRSFGPSHSDVISTRDDLAALHRAQGQPTEPTSLREAAVVAQIPAPERREAQEVKPPVAATHEAAPRMVDRPIAAAPPPQVTTAPAPRVGSPAPSSAATRSERPDGEELTRVLREIAGLQGTDAEPASAQQLYRRALAMMEATGATDRPELRTALRELGRLYYRAGAYAEAEPLLERALALAQHVLGPKAPEVGEIREELAWLRFSRRSLSGP